jgi:hypothetical protein
VKFFARSTKYFEVINIMKLIARTIAVALVLTGAVASTQISSASTTTKVSVARNSALPVPRCAPDDPNACGLAK